MSKTITLPDGTKCYSAPNCRKHFPATGTSTPQTVQAKDYVKISKTMSYLLRHQPDKANIVLSDDGWVEVEELVKKINQHSLVKPELTVNDVVYVVANDSKQRYFIQDGRIRAVQGHSTKVNLGLTPQEPPTFLYHGTSVETAPLIIGEGLKAMSRTHVHLSATVDTAITVGSRHGKPVVLIINASEAHRDGIKFYKADNGVWLADAIPNKYVRSDI